MEAYKNENLSFEERAKDLVSHMTLDEKVSQMRFQSPSIKRLGIPSYNWWNEALHGVARAGVATVFPQAIGMAATFNENLIEQVADVIATEGRARYHALDKYNDHDIYKGLTFWSPNVNIFRDPRWGRGHETYGEDPYLTAVLGGAYVRGLQGRDKKYLKAAACAKHFAVHSGPESLRHEFNAVVSKKDLWETYLYAFHELVTKAKVEGVMGAYNRTNGEPCCGSKTLLRDILRGKWKFDGYITSDCWAIKDFHEYHKVTKDAFESVALAVNNGCDLNCGNMYAYLLAAYEKGLVEEKTIDECVQHLMVTRMRLGMFDDPDHVPYTKIPFSSNDSPENNLLSLEVAKRSIVLLKNENGMLPLNKNKLRSIGVIGPNADSRKSLMGNYYGRASRYVTVLEGIKESVGDDVRVYFAEGCHLYKDRVDGLSSFPNDRIAEAEIVAKNSDVVVLCLGLDESLEGEEGDQSNAFASGDKPDLNLPGYQQKLLETVYETGTPVVLVLMGGSALSVNWADEHIPAILDAWYPGAQGGRAVASVLFGEFSPSGKLPVTFYRSTEELPDFEDYSMENRTYRFMKNEALYPFGYGLSYSSFECKDLTLSQDKVQAGDDIACSLIVENTGKYEADEIIQIYLKDTEASVRVPRWQLCGFRPVHLKPGEKTKVSFNIAARQMALIDEDGNCVLEPGTFILYAGTSQPDKRSEYLTGKKVLYVSFEVQGKRMMIEY
ncbi:glycoside hydrolase family 3 domain protein [[Clostridium] cellulosi]|uniref:Glycoside hydrolase family 3 domain protein n=1 Tax=[Clostridium] cellulosi TaxID=29343 RepID=A0A078KPV2_9FIRM|nr:glycoside hydrolase family 3 domain protein [[Clostridium] cellulosi]